jgi:hypothetical protein
MNGILCVLGIPKWGNKCSLNLMLPFMVETVLNLVEQSSKLINIKPSDPGLCYLTHLFF